MWAEAQEERRVERRNEANTGFQRLCESVWKPKVIQIGSPVEEASGKAAKLTQRLVVS